MYPSIADPTIRSLKLYDNRSTLPVVANPPNLLRPRRPRNTQDHSRMQHPLRTGVPATAPRFYITGRQPLNPGAILLAIVAAVGALSSVLYVLGHTGHAHLTSSNSGSARSAASADDEKDDPSQIDTIVLGDPADAPVPARLGDHVSPVHPTILVRLPALATR